MFIGHFPPKSLTISGSFAERDRQLKTSYASLPPCTFCVQVGVVANVYIWYQGCWVCQVCIHMGFGMKTGCIYTHDHRGICKGTTRTVTILFPQKSPIISGDIRCVYIRHYVGRCVYM